MGATNEHEPNLIDCKNAFINFKSFIDNISSEQGKFLEGYLVSHKDYKEFENFVFNNFEKEQNKQTYQQYKYNPYGNESYINAIQLKN